MNHIDINQFHISWLRKIFCLEFRIADACSSIFFCITFYNKLSLSHIQELKALNESCHHGWWVWYAIATAYLRHSQTDGSNGQQTHYGTYR